MSKRGPIEMPIRVRGKVYPSAKAAAKALGVARSTIYNLNIRGRIDSAGTGVGAKKGNIPHNAKPLKIGPVEFPSHAAAARALGYANRGRVWAALNREGVQARDGVIARAMAYAARMGG